MRGVRRLAGTLLRDRIVGGGDDEPGVVDVTLLEAASLLGDPLVVGDGLADLRCDDRDPRAGVGEIDGLLLGDAIVFLRPEFSRDFLFIRKQSMQLASKMRFLSAPWLGMLKDGAWLHNGKHANAMAEYLEASLRDVPRVKLMFPRQANAVFAELPRPAIEALWRKGWKFYTFIGQGGARLMCSWATTEQAVDALLDDVRDASHEA